MNRTRAVGKSPGPKPRLVRSGSMPCLKAPASVPAPFPHVRRASVSNPYNTADLQLRQTPKELCRSLSELSKTLELRPSVIDSTPTEELLKRMESDYEALRRSWGYQRGHKPPPKTAIVQPFSIVRSPSPTPPDLKKEVKYDGECSKDEQSKMDSASRIPRPRSPSHNRPSIERSQSMVALEKTPNIKSRKNSLDIPKFTSPLVTGRSSFIKQRTGVTSGLKCQDVFE